MTVETYPGGYGRRRPRGQRDLHEGRHGVSSGIAGRLLLVAMVAVVAAVGCSSAVQRAPRLTAAPSTDAAPSQVMAGTSAPGVGTLATGTRAAVCGKPSGGSRSAPPGAVSVDPAVVGDLAAKSEASKPGTTYWLAPGAHRLAATEFAQIQPKNGDTFVGAPGAVLDGGDVNRYAFTGKASHVTIRYLTIRRFVSPANEGVVNHDSGANWVIEHNTMIDNRGAALAAGPGQVMRGNCLKDNGQYGLNGCCGALRGIVLEANEFVGNNADDLEAKHPGCGCTGAMKLWAVDGADIRGNWIHDNHGPGIWADTNDNDFLVEGNLIEGNDGPAIFYEASYNVIIRNNVIRRNNLVAGRQFVARKDSFPSAAIYLSESGGDPRVPARTDKIDIYGNRIEDNWSGITLWENADRFCNSRANTSTGICTRLVSSVSRCSRPAIASPPLFGDCRWKTQRVRIHDNLFSVDPAAIGCTSGCARMSVLSNYGTFPAWSPYKGRVVQQAITFEQQNSWYDNIYVGPWTFSPYESTRHLNVAQWQAAPYRQDRGSTFTVSATIQPTASGSGSSSGSGSGSQSSAHR